MYPVMPLKRVLSRNDGGVWGDEPSGIADSPVLRSTDQNADGHWLEVEPAMRSLTPSERAKARLFAGDLLLTKSSGSAQHIGKTTLVTGAIAELKPAFSNFMQRLRVRAESSPAFYWYCFRSTFVRDQLNLISTTTTGLANLTATTIGELLVPVPRTDVQRQIAEYLDTQTAKIDALIAKQEQLIETLAERRQAVVSHAVTKGLDPNAPMAQSGLDWLGMIPSGWTLNKLSRTFVARKGATAGLLTSEYCASIPGEFPVYSGQTESDGVMAWIESYEFDAGNDGVLFSTTVGAKAMTVQHIVGRFSLSQNCMIVEPRHEQYVRYFYYYFQVLFGIQRRELSGHMQASFRMADLYNYRVVLPPLNEQKQIAQYLDHETAKIDALSTKAREMINVLKERRQALISAAVTGKIDVRENIHAVRIAEGESA